MVVGSGRHVVSKSRLCHVFRAHNAAIYVRKSVNKQIPDATRAMNTCLRKKERKKQEKKRQAGQKERDTDRFKKALLEARRIRQK